MTAALAGIVCNSFPEISPAVVLGASVVGSVWPDTPVATRMVFEKMLYGKHDLSIYNKWWFLWVEITHSIPVIMQAHYLLAIFGQSTSLTSQALGAFIWGTSGHIFVDCLTHGEERFKHTDQSMWWPFYPWLIKLKAGEVFCIAEYRVDYGVHPMKEFEKMFMTMSLVAIPIVWITIL